MTLVTDHILYTNDHPVQSAGRQSGLSAPVELVGPLEGFLAIEVNIGIEPLFCSDPFQVEFNSLPTSGGTTLQGGVICWY